MFSFFLLTVITPRFFLFRVKLKWLKNGGAKHLVIHLTTKSFNYNKLPVIFKAHVHYLRHRFINQKIKCKDGGSYFYKNQNYRPLEIENKIFLVLQKFLIFHKCVFQKMLNVLVEHSLNFFLFIFFNCFS